MKVNPNVSNQISGADTAGIKKTERPDSGRAAKGADKPGEKTANVAARGDVNAEISARAKDMSKAQSIAAEAPDVRQEKIDELKARIHAGKYNVDSTDIADRMVDDHMTMAGL